MGWLSKGKGASVFDAWRVVDSEEQLDELIKASHKHPVAILKHSVTCGISRMAMNGLQRDWDLTEDDLHFYYLDLLSYRPVSNAIAERSGVRHESPQVIIFKAGKAIYDASHGAISVSGIRQALAA